MFQCFILTWNHGFSLTTHSEANNNCKIMLRILSYLGKISVSMWVENR